jgi:hypothetical protein
VTALALATLGQRLPERLADQRPVVAECVSRNTDSGWRSMVCRGWGIPPSSHCNCDKARAMRPLLFHLA